MSSTEGVSWTKVSNAGYKGRQDSKTDSLNGILVTSGGDIGTDTPGNVNDVWACQLHTESNKQFQSFDGNQTINL